MIDKPIIILAIESSCDETSASVIIDGIVKSNIETAREMDRLNSYQVIYDKNYENLCLKI